MSKLQTISSILKIGVQQPDKLKKVVTAAKVTAKYGLVGLRERLHYQIQSDKLEVATDTAEPGELAGGIKFSILMPTYNVDVKWVSRAIESVENQSYGNWELCIADDASTSEELRSYLKSKQSDRILVTLLDDNVGISKATNEAARMATGDYVALMDNDDALYPDALFELYLRASSCDADVIYTDSDVIDEADNRLSVLFKPDWSPDLMLSQMYVGHLLAVKRDLFQQVYGFRSEFDGSQDYDLFLRLMLLTDRIEHISKVLYSWRALPTSTAINPDSKPYAQTAGLRAIQSYLDARYGQGHAQACETDDLYVYDIRYEIAGNPKASILIPTKDHVDDLDVAIRSILQKTAYQNFEIIVLNNNSELAESSDYFVRLSALDHRIHVIDAPIPFNWSKLNNLAASEAAGEVLVFLNNDTEVISDDWLTRLVEQALREDIGVVGGLLLYPDGSIQHAGVVVGMGGWADHVYKGCQPVHYGNPFISPMVTRNVSAVTGACMAISRKHFDELEGFNEDFIVCGSDVELCLHAEELGLRNVYTPYVRLKHYESKTRDAKDIPQIDFRLSEAMYRPYRAAGDPYFNRNLDYMKCVPTVLTQREKLQQDIREDLHVGLEEIRPLQLKRSAFQGVRLNIALPSINPEDVYGGISTALKFFNRLRQELGCAARIVVLDAEPRFGELGDTFSGFEGVRFGAESDAPLQIVCASNRRSNALPCGEGDWFIATCWWSAYCLQDAFRRFNAGGNATNPLLYLIQDYEPGFYAWSSRYVLAESTYRSDVPTFAVFNSKELHTHFLAQGYRFEQEFEFEPFLNPVLAQHLEQLAGTAAKRRQILVYGRPGTVRNAFELVVETLRCWIEQDPTSSQWQFLSAGEEHPPVYLSRGRYLTSVGKLSLDEYARVLSESYAGLSYMVSPHPSYPPLEMAAFGVNVITNNYGGKDLSTFSDSITSLPVLTPAMAANRLEEICASYRAEVPCGHVPSEYLKSNDPFPFIQELSRLMK